MDKYKGKYIANKKISSVKKIKEKTFFGNDKVEVSYKDSDEKEVFPLKVLDYIVTKEESDLTTLRDKRVIPVVQDILNILIESELRKEDLQYAIGPKLVESVNNNFREATSKLWGKQDYSVSLMDVQKVLSEKGKQKEN